MQAEGCASGTRELGTGPPAISSPWSRVQQAVLVPDGCVLITGPDAFTWLPYRAIVVGDEQDVKRFVDTHVGAQHDLTVQASDQPSWA